MVVVVGTTHATGEAENDDADKEEVDKSDKSFVVAYGDVFATSHNDGEICMVRIVDDNNEEFGIAVVVTAAAAADADVNDGDDGDSAVVVAAEAEVDETIPNVW